MKQQKSIRRWLVAFFMRITSYICLIPVILFLILASIFFLLTSGARAIYACTLEMLNGTRPNLEGLLYGIHSTLELLERVASRPRIRRESCKATKHFFKVMDKACRNTLERTPYLHSLPGAVTPRIPVHVYDETRLTNSYFWGAVGWSGGSDQSLPENMKFLGLRSDLILCWSGPYSQFAAIHELQHEYHRSLAPHILWDVTIDDREEDCDQFALHILRNRGKKGIWMAFLEIDVKLRDWQRNPRMTRPVLSIILVFVSAMFWAGSVLHFDQITSMLHLFPVFISLLSLSILLLSALRR